MSPDLHQQLEAKKKQLKDEVFSACVDSTEALPGEPLPPLDPAFADALAQAFRLTSDGRLEKLRMDVDILRRAQLAQGTEVVFRSFGIAQLLTPVKQNGKTVYLIASGPLKIGPWHSKEKATLAKYCNIPANRLPVTLEQATIYSHGHLQTLQRMQEDLAAAYTRQLKQAPPPPTADTGLPALSGAQLDVLQPGFADHLDLLFTTIRNQVAELENGPNPTARERAFVAARRGLHLIDQLRRLGDENRRQRANLSVHDLVTNWTHHITQQDANIRFDLKLKAKQHVLQASPHALNHLLYTLLSGIADGLSDQRPLIAVGSRDGEHEGRPCLHLEIRDSGGFATFAGVDAALDRALVAEQNDAADEFADWLGMAERIDAHLLIHRDDGIITRAELFLPLEGQGPDVEPDTQLPLVWIVLESDAEAEQLTRMLKEFGTRVERLHSGAEMKEAYASAPEPPDMVILDYLLSDTRGAFLRTWLYEQDQDIPVVLVSGFSSTHPGIATASNLPSTLYLQKPYDAQTLFDMLRMTLRETLPGA